MRSLQMLILVCASLIMVGSSLVFAQDGGPGYVLLGDTPTTEEEVISDSVEVEEDVDPDLGYVSLGDGESSPDLDQDLGYVMLGEGSSDDDGPSGLTGPMDLFRSWAPTLGAGLGMFTSQYSGGTFGWLNFSGLRLEASDTTLLTFQLHLEGAFGSDNMDEEFDSWKGYVGVEVWYATDRFMEADWWHGRITRFSAAIGWEADVEQCIYFRTQLVSHWFNTPMAPLVNLTFEYVFSEMVKMHFEGSVGMTVMEGMFSTDSLSLSAYGDRLSHGEWSQTTVGIKPEYNFYFESGNCGVGGLVGYTWQENGTLAPGKDGSLMLSIYLSGGF